MEKEAQKRRWRDSIREKVDIFGRGAEALSPTFSALMEKLRETDEKIRETLLDDDVKLKDVLKSARGNFNRREYMQAVADISTFHEKMEQVVDTIKVLELDVDSAHHEFLGTDLPTEAVEKLKRTRERIQAKKTKKAAQKAWIEKHAGGFSDLWYTLTSDRGKALRGWEKRYPSKMKQLKSHTASLINKSDSLFSTLLSSLKEMSSARAARNLDRYLKGAKKLTDTFNSYNTQYEKYYEDNIDNFLSKLVEKEKAAAALKAEKGEPTEDAKKVKTEETGIGEKEVTDNKDVTKETGPASKDYFVPSVRPPVSVNETPSSPSPEAPATEKDKELWWQGNETPSPAGLRPVEMPTARPLPRLELEMQSGPVSSKPAEKTNEEIYQQVQQRNSIPPARVPMELRPTLPSPGNEKEPDTKPMVKVPSVNSPGSKVQNNFIYMLESLSNEGPAMMALEINKFAKSIQKTNPQTSRKLLAIVEEILDGK